MYKLIKNIFFGGSSIQQLGFARGEYNVIQKPGNIPKMLRGGLSDISEVKFYFY